MFFSLFLFGKKVDLVLSFFLIWTLSLSAWRGGCVRPWRVVLAAPSSEALCSLSVFKSSEFAFNKGELGLEAMADPW